MNMLAPYNNDITKNFYIGTLSMDDNINDSDFSLTKSASEIDFNKIEIIKDLDEELKDEWELLKEEILELGNSDKKTIDPIVKNFRNSKIYFEKFIFAFDFGKYKNFKPHVSVDYDGEISIEWFGRKGARANLTFGSNSELYFVSIFHGETLKSKIYFSDKIPEQINLELEKIYRDSINE